MFQYNKPCITNTGETVTPYAKEGEFIACFDTSGNTVYKKIKDFSTKKEPKTITAVPKTTEEKIIQKAETTLKKEQKIEKEVLETSKIIKEEQVSKKTEEEKVTQSVKANKEKTPANLTSESQSIRKKDTWKKENNSKYKGNSIEE